MDEDYSRPDVSDVAHKLDRVIELLEAIEGHLSPRRNMRATIDTPIAGYTVQLERADGSVHRVQVPVPMKRTLAIAFELIAIARDRANRICSVPHETSQRRRTN